MLHKSIRISSLALTLNNISFQTHDISHDSVLLFRSTCFAVVLSPSSRSLFATRFGICGSPYFKNYPAKFWVWRHLHAGYWLFTLSVSVKTRNKYLLTSQLPLWITLSGRWITWPFSQLEFWSLHLASYLKWPNSSKPSSCWSFHNKRTRTDGKRPDA